MDFDQQLYNRYSQLEDAQLAAIYREGGLEPGAEAALQRVLDERGILENAGKVEAVEVNQSPGDTELQGLGGCLIPIGIGILGSIVLGIIVFANEFLPYFVDGSWGNLIDSSSRTYDPLLAAITGWEAVVQVAFIAMQVVLIYLFSQQSALFPRLYIWTFVALIVLSLSHALVLYLLYDYVTTVDNALFQINIQQIIPIIYLLTSRRVKNTFVRGKKKKKEVSEESQEVLEPTPMPAIHPLYERNALFDKWANDYDPSSSRQEFPFQGYDQVLDAVVEEVEPVPSLSLLDLGTGTGNLAARFLPFDCSITGVDFSQEMLDRAAQLLPDAELIRADIREPLPLYRRFDRIVSGYLFHEFNDENKLVLIERLLRDHLAPGGKLLIGDISFPDQQRREEGHRRWKELWDESEHYWAAGEMIERLRERGFEVTYRQVSECGGVYCILP